MRQPILHHPQVVRLGRLLDMLYRPAEIAEELGLHPDTVYRSYLPAGLPHTRDATGNIWIHGPAFAAWARATLSARKTKKHPLAEGQAWCMKCNLPVNLDRPHIRPVSPVLELLTAPCPNCKTTVNRIQRTAQAGIVPALGASSSRDEDGSS